MDTKFKFWNQRRFCACLTFSDKCAVELLPDPFQHFVD